MMKTTTWKPLMLFSAVLGFGGLGLRYFLYQTAVDEKGLLTAMHPLELGFWAAAVLAALLALFAGRKNGPEASEAAPTAAGLLLAAGMIFSQHALRGRSGLMTIAWFLLLITGALMAFSAAPGIKKDLLGYLAPVGVCLFFAVYLVASYQQWSSNPQMQDYAAEMLACVILMLYAYQQAALSQSAGSDRARKALSVLAVFFCLSAVPGSETPLLCLGGAAWAMLTPKSGKKS